MQDTQALGTEQEQLTTQPTPEVQAQAEAGEQISETELLRLSMARNYLQHCINSAVAERGPEAAIAGVSTAMTSLILTAFNANPDAAGLVLETIAGTLGELKVGEQALPELLMEVWVVSQARQGRLNALIGKLRDCAELDRNQFMMNQMQQLSEMVTTKDLPAPDVATAPKEQDAAQVEKRPKGKVKSVPAVAK